MCGIAGTVSGPGPIHDGTVERMTAALRHRGPEGTSYARLGDAHFGFCRLAFVDIEYASQPLLAPSGKFLVTFNGEIYNHRELRQLTPPETTPGEVGVIAALYAQHGAEFTSWLNGMFAIAIYDCERRELLLFRDRAGKKPLYYFCRGRGGVFASELRALAQHPDCPSELDPQAVAEYLTFHAVPAPRAMFAGVCKVPAGGMVRIRDGAAEVRIQWRPRLAPREMPFEERVAEADRLLTAAVRRRFSEEVPFGIFLSGGLDSSVVAGIASRYASSPLASFSVGFPDALTFDESPHAERAAASLGLRHTTVRIPLAVLAGASVETLERIDEPLADHSLVCTAALARESRRAVKAVLTGDGADELLMGYRLFEVERVLGILGRVLRPRILASGLKRIASGPPSDSNLHFRHVAKLLARSLVSPPAHRYYEAAAAFPPSEWELILSGDARRAASANAYRELDSMVEQSGASTGLEQLQIGIFTHFLRDGILAKLDRATMMWGLEARSPFLDCDLMDHLLGTPVNCKLRGFNGKFLLKRMARRYVPAEIINRKKQGFRSPVSALLRGPLREFLYDRLSDGALNGHGLFQIRRVRQLLAEHFGRLEDHHRSLWALLCFQCWWDSARAHRTSAVEARESAIGCEP